MIRVTTMFDDRVKEIDSYLRFLRHSTKDGATIVPRTGARKQVTVMDRTILKAHAVLMLYNLVEATLQQCLQEVYDQIHADGLDYLSVADGVRTVWARFQSRRLADSAGAKRQSVFEELAQELIARSVLQLESKHYPTPGNVDARVIGDSAAVFGYKEPFKRSKPKREALFAVKDARNNLAHGNVSFEEYGRNLSLSQLESYRRHTVAYLRELISSFEQYIANKEFVA